MMFCRFVKYLVKSRTLPSQNIFSQRFDLISQMDIFNDGDDDETCLFSLPPSRPMTMISSPPKLDVPEKQSVHESAALTAHRRLIEAGRREVDHLNLSSVTFNDAVVDQNLKLNPVKLGFIPRSFWHDTEMTFGQMRTDFFRRKNNSNCRFPHKLYDALILSELKPEFIDLVGCQWVDDTTIKINRENFARLLGIKSVEGSLFHKQGNFPSHGFIEVDPQIVRARFPDFDFGKDRLLTHKDGVFVRGCTEEDILRCRWHVNTV